MGRLLRTTPATCLATATVVAFSFLVVTLAWATQVNTRDPADLIATLQPAVVNISIHTMERTGPVPGNMVSQPTVSEHGVQGSGFFITSSGIIVTNRHTVAGATEITVTLHDATKLTACVVAAAVQSDIALLRVNASKPVPTLRFGDSEGVRPGDPIFVIGNPLDLGSTVTGGIVSALDRNNPQSQFGSFF